MSTRLHNSITCAARLRRMRAPAAALPTLTAGADHRIGISAAAVSQWRRVPAERVLEVEKASGVSRSALRPDLYPIEGKGEAA